MRPRQALAGIDDLVTRIQEGQAAHARAYPGAAPGARQPVHTRYVAADQFSPDMVAEDGRESLRLLDAHAPDGRALAAALEIDEALADQVRPRVAAKLAREPVEDVRIDFEDGYGIREDAEEDAHAEHAARAVAEAASRGLLPGSYGLRIKSFADGRHLRSIRTLDVFLSTLVAEAGEALPGGFVVTFPKVVMVDHVAALAELLGRLEPALSLPPGSLRFEVQVETTESLVDNLGGFALRRMAETAGGRLAGAHFGVFDYTAACGLPPGEQRLDHPACDFARHVMQVALAGTGVALSDGSTNVRPASDDTDAVHRAWRAHAEHIRHSLRHGYRQGWDLHAAQLPSRFAAVYAFYLEGLDTVFARIRAWRDGVPGPGGFLDEPATISALTAHVRRAVASGAVEAGTVADILE